MLLTFRALASQERLKFELACLERWGLLVFHPAATEDRPARFARMGEQNASCVTAGAVAEGFAPLGSCVSRAWG